MKLHTMLYSYVHEYMENMFVKDLPNPVPEIREVTGSSLPTRSTETRFVCPCSKLYTKADV